jgi:hypothetical protein
MRIVLSCLALAALVASAFVAASPALAVGGARNEAVRARPAAAVVKNQQLTHWRTIGYWAHVSYAVPVHAWPTTNSRIVTRLHYRTEQKLPEVYLVLARRVTRDGRTWLKLALPMWPNGKTGWVVHRALGRLNKVESWLVVDLRRLRARFFERGRSRSSFPIGVGKPSTPTPRGLFWVREEFAMANQAAYGPYAFGTSAYSKIRDWAGGDVVALHGTSAPGLVPGRPSHGCVRFHNPDILWLAHHMPVGTPVAVIN